MRTWGFPVLVGGVFATWLGLREQVDPGVLGFVLLVAVAALVTVLERRIPARPEWRSQAREAAVDGLYLVGGLAIFGPLAHLVAVDPIVGVVRPWRATFDWHLVPTGWPLGVKVLGTLLVAEFFGWSFHRAQHRYDWLWRFHATHHAPTRMGWLKGPVNHPLEHFFLAGIKAIPLALLGAEREAVGGAGLLYAVVNLLAHANLDLHGGVFAWVFTSPGQHLRHHSLDPAEGRSNYGCAVILWDRLLGTYSGDAAPERASIRLGIDDGRPLSLREQLMLPFRRGSSGQDHGSSDVAPRDVVSPGERRA